MTRRDGDAWNPLVVACLAIPLAALSVLAVFDVAPLSTPALVTVQAALFLVLSRGAGRPARTFAVAATLGAVAVGVAVFVDLFMASGLLLRVLAAVYVIASPLAGLALMAGWIEVLWRQRRR